MSTVELFVSDISAQVSEAELRQLFSLCGTVRSLYLPRTPDGRHKGIAFVRMSTQKQTREALNMLDETLLHEHCIRVRPARPKADRIASPPDGEPSMPPGFRGPKRRKKPR